MRLENSGGGDDDSREGEKGVVVFAESIRHAGGYDGEVADGDDTETDDFEMASGAAALRGVADFSATTPTAVIDSPRRRQAGDKHPFRRFTYHSHRSCCPSPTQAEKLFSSDH